MTNARRVTRIRGSMQQSVEDATAAMTWLKPSDDGLVALAIRYAAEIDRAGDDLRAIGYLGQNLMGTLRALGGAPAERKLLDAEGAVGGRLAELRQARAARQRDAEDLDSSGERVDT